MKELIVHADSVSYEVTKKTKLAEEIPDEMKEGKMDDVLWVRIAVEKEDEGDLDSLVKKAVSDIEEVSGQVKTKNVMLYPYAHLLMGSKPSKPEAAIELIKKMEEELKGKGFEVMRSPFGWYKKFTVSCKGHPLSELSRVFVAEESEKGVEVSESVKMEEKMTSKFFIMGLDGKLVPADEFDYTGHENLKKFATYETKKARVYEKEPPHIKLMQEQELVDYEPGSDGGNFRFYPKGKLIKKLIDRSITDFCVDYGAMEVETPIMYDYEHPSLKKYLNRFPARQYLVTRDDRKLFLRFAACFGQFLMAQDMVFSYRQLPMRMFELTRYSFRSEQTGELAGLKRLRAFTMPDMHGILRDMEQAKTELEQQLEISMEWLSYVRLLEGSEVGFRILKEFYEENKEWYAALAKKVGKPMLVEIFDERYAYFITKFEFNFVDSMDKASALTTVQIDVENAETYDISFVGEDGSRKRPILTHASISGSTERVIYALLEKEAMKMAKGEKAMLPLWLCPTQVRILPISEKHVEFAQEVLSELGDSVRADIDDTSETLGKKIRNAQKEWVPYIAVIGDTEVESGKVSVTIRETGEKNDMDGVELRSMIEEKTNDMPFEKLSLPKLLSKRPTFRG
ncbi:threonine--tRNA ligase [Candidatus Micrarchaeota archaeon]|nr:threonine--tRNA ligase [Candidatus Micrarchaeota archaeon]MBD3417906.1 threonine--tRNA ligase [Candidatus Micrarchaeota archaeon]